MTEITSYLKNLKFDPKLLSSTFGKYLQNVRLVILLVLLLVVVGVVSYTSLPRVLNPSIKIPIVSVSTSLPGASPQDVESLLTIPVEDSLGSLQKVQTMTSSSRDSVSSVTIEFESGVDPDEAKRDVQSAVDSIPDLPEDAQSPRVQKFDFENEPVWTFTLSSKKSDSASLVRYGKTLRDKMEDLSSVDHVDATGLDTEEIQVLVDPAKIAAYGINPTTLSQAIKASTGSLPGGSLTTNNSAFVLTIDPTITDMDTLRNLRIKAGGTTVQLSDIAQIRQHTKPDTADSYIATQTQKPSQTIRFDVYKKSSVNITDTVTASRKTAEDLSAQYGNNFVISSVTDTGEEIDKQYNELVRDMGITVALVFIILFLFLGVRQAVVASVSIPLTFLFTFTVMHMTGIALSFIAFFSFLLSLGLLVDDTIVVISALTAYYRTRKFNPLEAGLLVWRDFKTAILTTTLTTVWAFVPLLLSSGIIGEFIKPIPIVVSSTLIGSFVVAMFITLPVMVIILNSKIPHRVVILLRVLGLLVLFGIFMALAPQGALFLPALLLFLINLFIIFQVRHVLRGAIQKRFSNVIERSRATKQSSKAPQKSWGLPRFARNDLKQYMEHGVISFDIIGHRYRQILLKILSAKQNRRKAVIAVLLFSVMSFMLLPLGFVKNEFFPKSDANYLFLSLEMPAGTNKDQTEKESLKLLEDVRKIPDVSFATSTLRLSIDPGRGYGGAQDNNALITLVLPEGSERKYTSIELADQLRDKYSSYSAGKVSVVEESGGPPAGSDIQIKLFGDELQDLDGYASKLETYLKKQPGTTNVSKSITPGTSKVVFIPDYQKMLDAGVTQQQIALFLRTYANGFSLEDDVRFTGQESDKQTIVLRTDSKPQTLEKLSTVSLPTETGNVALGSLGKFELKPNPTLITREEGKRTISVSAGVAPGYSVTDLNKNLESFADSINLPDGYSWQTGGVNEENNKSVTSIMQAMLLSFFLIIVTMVLQFSSFRKALIVMLVIPLSISGVFIVFAITNTPLSFPALIGTLALFGIVVKNSILVVDKITQNLRSGMGYTEAVVDGAESRLEPVALTSFAAIVGLIPITLSDPLWRGLGGAIISGLFFSGSIMLFFIPVVYYLMFQDSEGKTNPDKKVVK